MACPSPSPCRVCHLGCVSAVCVSNINYLIASGKNQRLHRGHAHTISFRRHYVRRWVRGASTLVLGSYTLARGRLLVSSGVESFRESAMEYRVAFRSGGGHVWSGRGTAARCPPVRGVFVFVFACSLKSFPDGGRCTDRIAQNDRNYQVYAFFPTP